MVRNMTERPIREVPDAPSRVRRIGRIRYVMEDGTEVIGEPGDHLLIEPGHLAEVMGDEVCVLIDW